MSPPDDQPTRVYCAECGCNLTVPWNAPKPDLCEDCKADHREDRDLPAPTGHRKLDDRQRLAGFATPTKRTISLHMRIDTRSVVRWRAYAKQRGCNLSELVRTVMDQFLTEEERRRR